MKKTVYEWCPNCGCEATFAWDAADGYLMQCPNCSQRLLLCSECDRKPCDYDAETDLCKHIVEQMWDELSDIPMEVPKDGEEYFSKPFTLHGIPFPAGITRTELWHWFDRHYPKGVYALLYQE